MAKDRPPSFPLYARDFLADPVIIAMTKEQVGRYFISLCQSWLTDTPGVAPESEWQFWMGYSDDEWERVRPLVIRAFRVTGKAWRQRRMAEEWDAQLRWRERAARGGVARSQHANRVGGKFAGHNNITSEPPAQHQQDHQRSPALPLPLPLPLPLKEESKTTHLVESGDSTALVLTPPDGKKPTPKADEWVEAFGEFFWPAYPRKVAKPAALKAWRAIKPQTEEMLTQIIDGLAPWVKYWKQRGDPDFVAHPSTWLNQHRWEDKP